MDQIHPEDIQNISFHTVAFGYKKEEVDQYLDDIAVSVQALWNEMEELKRDIAEQAERIDYYRNLEEDLKNTFILAQQSAGEIRENAVKESEMLIKENELKVEQILVEGQKKIDAMQEYYTALKRKVTNHKSKMKADIKTMLHFIDENEEREQE